MRILLSVLSICAMLFLNAQDDLPMPEYVNQVVHYDPSTKGTKQLEKVVAKPVTKSKYFVAEAWYVIKGETSSVNINQSKVVQFLVNADTDVSIDEKLKLIKWESKKKERRVKYQSGSSFGSKSIDIFLPYEFKKIEGKGFLIKVDYLEPGEYGFSNEKNTYCFTIAGS